MSLQELENDCPNICWQLLIGINCIYDLSSNNREYLWYQSNADVLHLHSHAQHNIYFHMQGVWKKKQTRWYMLLIVDK